MDFLWTPPFSEQTGILTHLTNIHYSTEQEYYLEKERTQMKNDLTANMTTIPNHDKILKHLRDTVLGPNLKTLKHNNLMLLIGNDFAFLNTEVGPDK